VNEKNTYEKIVLLSKCFMKQERKKEKALPRKCE